MSVLLLYMYKSMLKQTRIIIEVNNADIFK